MTTFTKGLTELALLLRTTKVKTTKVRPNTSIKNTNMFCITKLLKVAKAKSIKDIPVIKTDRELL